MDSVVRCARNTQQQKASLFEAVIDVLRKDYGVSVVKKPLGKSYCKTLSRG